VSKIETQVDARNIVDEIEKLMDVHYEKERDKGFAESYPELYWAVYIPSKTALKRWGRSRL